MGHPPFCFFDIFVIRRLTVQIPSLALPFLLFFFSCFGSGGVLGFFCSHSYPHASKEAHEFFPQALKGVDAAVYAALNSLGIKTEVLPVIQYEKDWYDSGSDSGDEDLMAVGEKLKPYSDVENGGEEFQKDVSKNPLNDKISNRSLIWNNAAH